MVPKMSIDVLKSQSIKVSKEPNYIIKQKKEEVPREEARWEAIRLDEAFVPKIRALHFGHKT